MFIYFNIIITGSKLRPSKRKEDVLFIPTLLVTYLIFDMECYSISIVNMFVYL